MTSILVTLGVGFAVLGVQYAIWCAVRDRLQIIHDSAFQIDRMTVEAKLRFSHIDAAIHDVQATSSRTGNSLKDHAEESRVSHKASFDVVCSSGQKFANASDALHERANALKVHAQELLDRSEAHAITPRQAVSR